jgi:hypothetical protein
MKLPVFDCAGNAQPFPALSNSLTGSSGQGVHIRLKFDLSQPAFGHKPGKDCDERLRER